MEKKNVVRKFVSAVAIGASAAHTRMERRMGTHIIVWKDEDGKVLSIDEVENGALPVHGPLPNKMTNPERYFAGWHPKIVPAAGTAAYTARFIKVDRENGAIPFEFFEHVSKRNCWAVTYYTDDYFRRPSIDYMESRTTFALCLELSSGYHTLDSAYNSECVERLLGDIGCTRISVNEYYRQEKKSNDQIGVAIGMKTIDDFPMLFVVVQGTNYGAEFGGNMMVGNGMEYSGNHKGFSLARNTVLNFLKKTIKEYGLSGRIKVLITGYSRGAAVTNLTAAYLCDRIAQRRCDEEFGIDLKKEDLYAFCFEPPLCGAIRPFDDDRYDCITCVIDPNDPVTKIPLRQFGFITYGRKVYLPSNDRDAVMRMKGYMDSYFGEGTSSYYNMLDFIPSDGLETQDQMLEAVMERAYNSFGNRKFYADKIESDITYVVHQVLRHTGAIKNANESFDPQDVDMNKVFEMLVDQNNELEKASKYFEEATNISGQDLGSIRRINRQVLDLLLRFNRSDLIFIIKMTRLNRKTLVTPHYPLGPLSYLMMDDPNYRMGGNR